MAHARFSPSAAHRWIPCPGSMILEKDIANTSSVHADEGTAAHFLASECLERDRNATDFLNCFIVVKNGNAAWDNENAETRTGFCVDLEMSENVQKYLDAVRSQADGNELLIEQRVNFSNFIDAENAFGTGDAIIIGQSEIQVHDLKYGRGVKVDAENNEQLKLYALGALSDFGMFGDFTHVRLVIHQPRLNHVSESVVSIEDLYDFAHRAKNTVQMIKAIDAGAAIFEAKDMLNPGEKQCHWCKAKATCPALIEHVIETVAGEFDVLSTCDLEVEIKQAVEDVPQHENQLLAKLYAALPLIE